MPGLDQEQGEEGDSMSARSAAWFVVVFGFGGCCATVPGLGISPNSGWVAIQQSVIFLNATTLDIPGDVGEILGDDADLVIEPDDPARVHDDFAQELIEERDPLVLGVRVDGSGTIFVRH